MDLVVKKKKHPSRVDKIFATPSLVLNTGRNPSKYTCEIHVHCIAGTILLPKPTILDVEVLNFVPEALFQREVFRIFPFTWDENWLRGHCGLEGIHGSRCLWNKNSPRAGQATVSKYQIFINSY